MSRAPVPAPPAVPVPFWFNAWVIDWHDGDSGTFRVDRGDRDYSTWTIRALGYAARELKDPGGPEAQTWLTGLLPPGSPVVLSTVKPDKYGGRRLARIFYTPLRGTVLDLAETMTAERWGARWDGTGKQPQPPWPREMP